MSVRPWVEERIVQAARGKLAIERLVVAEATDKVGRCRWTPG